MVKRFKDFVGEEMTSTMMSGGGEIRGLGHVSGDPAIGTPFVNTWTTMNAADADTQDTILNRVKREVHDDIHAPTVADVVKSTQDQNKPEIEQNKKRIADVIRGKR